MIDDGLPLSAINVQIIINLHDNGQVSVDWSRVTSTLVFHGLLAEAGAIYRAHMQQQLTKAKDSHT